MKFSFIEFNRLVRSLFIFGCSVAAMVTSKSASADCMNVDAKLEPPVLAPDENDVWEATLKVDCENDMAEITMDGVKFGPAKFHELWDLPPPFNRSTKGYYIQTLAPFPYMFVKAYFYKSTDVLHTRYRAFFWSAHKSRDYMLLDLPPVAEDE